MLGVLLVCYWCRSALSISVLHFVITFSSGRVFRGIVNLEAIMF